jgi:S-adenosylmethionine hydrolase
MHFNNPQIPLIATYTDFGLTGPYHGQMASVIAAEAPQIPQVILMADAPMFDPQAAGLLLSYIFKPLPPQTLILGVVDPGVGGNRRPIMIMTERHILVGPDNGLFIPILHRLNNSIIETIDWRPEQLSETFHGRDIFAPVAAKLASGKQVQGTPLLPQDLVAYDSILDFKRIIYIDNYGNAMTAINAADVERNKDLFVNGTTLHYARTFSEVPIGHAFWYCNSLGVIEIAVNCGSAVTQLNLELGMSVEYENK